LKYGVRFKMDQIQNLWNKQAIWAILY